MVRVVSWQSEKTYLFHKPCHHEAGRESMHHRLSSSLRTDSTDFTTGEFLLSISVFFVFSFFIILFCLVPCGRLSWLLVSFWAHVNIVNRIVTRDTSQQSAATCCISLHTVTYSWKKLKSRVSIEANLDFIN